MGTTFTPIKIAVIRAPVKTPDGKVGTLAFRILVSNSEGKVHAHDLDTNQLAIADSVEQAMTDLKENILWYIRECEKDPDHAIVTPAPRELIDIWNKLLLQKLDQGESKPQPWFEWSHHHQASPELVAI